MSMSIIQWTKFAPGVLLRNQRTFLSGVFPSKSDSGLSRGSIGIVRPVERVEMRLSFMTVRERNVCFDVVKCNDGCNIDYSDIDTVEIGYQKLSVMKLTPLVNHYGKNIYCRL